MFRNKLHRALFEENKDGNGGGATAPETTPDSEAGKDTKKEDENTIPYARFKEVNDKYKEAKAELDKYEAEKKAKEEQEAIAKGEQEKVIAQKNQEIEALKKEQETWKARENAISEKNTQRIADLEKKFGDKWGEYKNLVDDITDPFTLSNKLDSLEKLSANSTAKAPDGGSKMPGGSGQGRKQELMDKLKKEGRLTAKEQSELFSLTDTK